MRSPQRRKYMTSNINTSGGGNFQTGGVDESLLTPPQLPSLSYILQQLDSLEASYTGSTNVNLLVASPNADLPLLNPPKGGGHGGHMQNKVASTPVTDRKNSKQTLRLYCKPLILMKF